MTNNATNTTVATATNETFHSVVEVKRLLKEARDLNLYGSVREVQTELESLLVILSHKVTMDTSALHSLLCQLAFKTFCVTCGASESTSFSAVVPYDCELLNGTLTQGRWYVQTDSHTRTMEVSTESFR